MVKSDRGDMDFGEIRRDYRLDRLDETLLPDDPMALLKVWMEQAQASVNADPTAMTLSTVGQDGHPSSRTVLLKRIEKGKLLFFTNYRSRKAQEISTEAHVAIHFYWPELERQVRISGIAGAIDETESDRYFQERPLESKISAWISPQSEVIPSRQFLEQAYKRQLKKYHETGHVARPGNWGGYAILPMRMEFWQGGTHRLHDRIEYAWNEGQWVRVRLAP